MWAIDRVRGGLRSVSFGQHERPCSMQAGKRPLTFGAGERVGDRIRDGREGVGVPAERDRVADRVLEACRFERARDRLTYSANERFSAEVRPSRPDCTS